MLIHTFFEQHNTRKSVVKVPEVNAANTPLVVQLAVYIERLVRGYLHLPQLLARISRIRQRGRVLVAPWRPVAVAVAVVVAEKILALSLRTPSEL
jgi:hypothetical protein